MLNVHPSLLPRWRGAAPIERAMMAGDAETGVAIMRAHGRARQRARCACMEREPIRADDTFGTLSARLAALGGELLVRALDERPPFAEQPEDGVTYAEKIAAEDRMLDPARARRRARAHRPRARAARRRAAGAAGRRVPRRAGALSSRRRLAHEPGTLGSDGRERCCWAAPDGGALELMTVQPPGKRPMPAADYLRGHAL